MTEHDSFVYEWYSENVTGFAKEFGLMPELLKPLKIEGEELSFFLFKCNMIYQSAMNIQEKKRKENA